MSLILLDGCTILVLYFFFFQAEDGIRDWSVTGVQTCALPILTVVVPNYPSAFVYLASSGLIDF